ncbi:uncharacterized protein LOC115229283 isoform X2 [Octopus sinensis]|uniref:Uncharacterized protein LOC115229283 isoform X2 n=1 Tax=Octopus sinensis TaxID=2607531 RepID=A0A6P7U1U9_9MOLL|nr:uncharacterized protein LOC115229283 isoform X2 [Octopus sinensis]
MVQKLIYIFLILNQDQDSRLIQNFKSILGIPVQVIQSVIQKMLHYAVVILNCSDNMRINFKLKDNCPQGMILCFEYSGPCHIKTPHVPVEPKKLSTGSIISIVTFSIIIVYLVGGCLVTSFYLNSTGMERCPNVTLWSKLGSLIKVRNPRLNNELKYKVYNIPRFETQGLTPN